MSDFDDETCGAFSDGYYDGRPRNQGRVSKLVRECKPLALSNTVPASQNQPLQAGSRIREVAYAVAVEFNGCTVVKVGTAAQPTKFGTLAPALGTQGSMRLTAGLDEFLQDTNDDIVITFDSAPTGAPGKLRIDVYRERTLFE